MSLHLVPEPMPPLAERVLAALRESGPLDLAGVVQAVVKPGLITDADLLIAWVCSDLIQRGMVRTDLERYWAVTA